MIDSAGASDKSSNDYLQSIRQQLGLGHSDKATKRTHKKELGKNDFIKLMSVQLQNQDPTSPMKNEEMAAQLAQFSSLEQMQNVNTTLEKMSKETKSRDNLMASQFIGKEVVTDSSRFEIDENRRADLKFELKGNVEKGDLAVLNENGEVIREIPLSKLAKGPNSIVWDGRDRTGIEAKVGAYSFRVTAYDQAEKPVEVKTGSTGIVGGVEFEKGQPVLLVEGKRLPLGDISKIQDPLVDKMIEALGKNNNAKPAGVDEKATKDRPEMSGPITSQNEIQDSAAAKAKELDIKRALENIAPPQLGANPKSPGSGEISQIEPREGLEGMELFNPKGTGI